MHIRRLLGQPWLCLPLLTAVIGSGWSSSTWADDLHVDLDVTSLVGCRDTTPVEFYQTHPGQKLIEARFLVSLRVTGGRAADLTELNIDLRSTDERLLVWDFEPDSRLESDTVGEIEVTRTREKTENLGSATSATAQLPMLPVPVQVAPTASLGTSRREVVTEKSFRLPAQQLAIASGTTHSGYGVFFKFRHAPRQRLEGQHELVCWFVVPQAWRGDWVELRCQVRGQRRRYWVENQETIVVERAYVALYQQGDLPARQAAQRVVRLQADRPNDQATKLGLPSLKAEMSELLAGSKARLVNTYTQLTYPLRWRSGQPRRPSLDVEKGNHTPSQRPFELREALDQLANLGFVSKYVKARTTRASRSLP